MRQSPLSAAALGLLLLLIATACDIMCGLSPAKRAMMPSERSDNGAPKAAAAGSLPSPRSMTLTTRPNDVLCEAAAAKATRYSVEISEEASPWRCPQRQCYTPAEVSRHMTEDDLWIVVSGNVLNVSGFVPHHPGGDVLLDGAGGQDMATVFADLHHPSSVNLVAEFCIGRILLE
ncbi:hypothetical protein LSCM1_05615 [Leishmania martiniquensis]|uniref:Cytochrome b5 heme-binding domain-containing protein n=1 Tax=Leishmania martiniquensis TaxID=1580590 RepID=A0A836GUJ2_9TRYP|nr:hypothetical protein LSCM1_05615 [Leishmania martiniquensis]